MRKTITLMTALAIVLAMSGWACGDWGDTSVEQHHGWFGNNQSQIAQQVELGPYEVDVFQSSILSGNKVTIGQKGEYVKATVDQTSWGSNDATICQIGDNLKAKLEQESVFGNYGVIHQEGNNSKAKVEQIADGFFGWNSANIRQYADNSKIKVKQEGSANNADVLQTGNYSQIKVKQEATGYNNLNIEQIGSGCGNKIKLVQEATGRGGWCKPAGYNEADIEQHGSHNKLVGASYETFDCTACAGITGTKAVVRWCKPAIQTGLYNELDLYQSGCGNTVGLYQNADTGFNKADITQTGGGNKLAIYQDAATGNNIVDVEQTGGQEAYIYQGDKLGGGSIYVYQGT